MPRFRVIGVRGDGSEVVLAESVTMTRADEICQHTALAFASIRIEQKKPRKRRQPPTLRDTWKQTETWENGTPRPGTDDPPSQ